ncbi:hypothetical protein D5E85_26050, partial [Vibrio parahaemolyticus]
LTRRLRRIHNALRSQFKLNLVFKVQWFRFGGCVVHHLTRRYVERRLYENIIKAKKSIKYQYIESVYNENWIFWYVGLLLG